MQSIIANPSSTCPQGIGEKTGERYEPEFKGPELLSTALSGLGTKIELTMEQLCRDLHFEAETFLTVTGVPVPLAKGRPVEVIPIRA